MSPVIFWEALSRVSLKNTPGVGGYYEPSKKKLGSKFGLKTPSNISVGFCWIKVWVGGSLRACVSLVWAG